MIVDLDESKGLQASNGSPFRLFFIVVDLDYKNYKNYKMAPQGPLWSGLLIVRYLS